MTLSDTSLIASLYQMGAIQFGEFTLKSGQPSSVYVNLRKIISYPSLLQTIANVIWETARYCQFDSICGVPYTALPLATCISLQHDVPMIMRRKEKKDYGTKQMIEGEFKQGQRCLIIEDVVTTGSSIIETAAELENVGLKVVDVVALIDREQGGRENLKSRGYHLLTVLTLPEILKSLLAAKLISEKEWITRQQQL